MTLDDVMTVCTQVMPDVMSFLEQRLPIFSGTVKYNLRVGLAAEWDAMADVSHRQLKEACIAAGCWSDLKSEAKARGVKHVLDIDVGLRGKAFNPGLVQRLCLARCLLRQKPLLLLDEPMSAQVQSPRLLSPSLFLLSPSLSSCWTSPCPPRTPRRPTTS